MRSIRKQKKCPGVLERKNTLLLLNKKERSKEEGLMNRLSCPLGKKNVMKFIHKAKMLFNFFFFPCISHLTISKGLIYKITKPIT